MKYYSRKKQRLEVYMERYLPFNGSYKLLTTLFMPGNYPFNGINLSFQVG